MPVVRSGQDTFVDSTRPARNFVGTNALSVQSPGNATHYSYLYFQNPAPRRATIQRATLRLWAIGSWGTGNTTVYAQRIQRSIKFGQVNWNNRPGVVGGIATTTQPSASNLPTMWEFNVTPQVQAMTNGTVNNFGFRLSSPSTVRRQFWSLNATHHQPRLEVVWTDAPQRPTSLKPSGGQVVSVQRPVFDFDYVDVGGNTQMAAYQVQFHTSANWSSPNWNSGRVVSSESEFDSSVVTNAAGQLWGGLSYNNFTYWRVRVQDGAGLWSRWSAIANGVGARFGRREKGTVTITNPGTAATISDWSPPISWTYTGPWPQRQWRVTLTEPDDPSRELYTTGIRTGTATSHTIPRGYLTRSGARYRVIVDIFDDRDRVYTANDFRFVRAWRIFTFTETTAVAPAQNLEGTMDPIYRRPYMTLTWTRSSTPDRWNILRNGNLVEANIPGPDLLLGPGGRYRYVDKDASINREHTWMVQAWVNGQISANNPRYTGKIETLNAWIMDRFVESRMVPIFDPEVSFEMPDMTATYEPIARTRVVRVAQTMRGIQGTVSGRITTFAGTSARQFQNHIIWMKNRPMREFRLVFGDFTWRVLLGDVVITPEPLAGNDVYGISFSFWSTLGPPRL